MRILAILPEGDPAAPFSSTSVYRPRRPRLARSALPNLDAMTSSPDRHPRLHRPSAGSGGQPRPPPDSEVRFGNASYICRRLHYLIPLLGGSIAPRRAPEHPFVLLMRRAAPAQGRRRRRRLLARPYRQCDRDTRRPDHLCQLLRPRHPGVLQSDPTAPPRRASTSRCGTTRGSPTTAASTPGSRPVPARL